MNTNEIRKESGADTFAILADQRRERIVTSGDMTAEQANEWYSNKADQWN